ncbi:MAG TPA: UDP-N-acetylglucosamine 2-epimerase (non-hydrolyzing) [Pyrinomonadaceae bacterium]|nr:UDP-N-acetylglucosamine 2-epimerase (non-hydrolyzing) [Pyrinomonadaceae bacterium]
MLDSFGKTSKQTNEILDASKNSPRKVLVLFGTRPEAIKLAPVVHELKKTNFQTIIVSSSQHTDLLAPFLKIFNLKIDYDLRVMTANQTPSEVCARVLSALDVILEREKPEIILVQGDTTTAFAGAFAAFNRKIKIGHVEAGLRSGDALSPFPEESNRRLISQIATFHFCATTGNKRNLLVENVAEKQIFVCGNTVVDALHFILKTARPSTKIKKLLGETKSLKRILLTTHRRESFGDTMSGNLKVLREFVAKREDICLVFPVHPNPSVRNVTDKILTDRERIFLLEPLDYVDFAALMKSAWLIVSDSGGVQEEAPSLGKPLLVLRENTERPEALESGIAKLVGADLKNLLKENYADESWINSVKEIENPFGDGKSAKRIVEILTNVFHAKTKKRRVISAEL